MFPRHRLAALFAPLLLLGCLSAAAGADEVAAPSDEAAALSEEHGEWLELVKSLISEVERDAFLELDRDYQRDAFIRRFWEVRDPFPQTGRNEFREAWESHADAALELYGSLESERAQALLLFGSPGDIRPLHCSQHMPRLEVWYYGNSMRVHGSFNLVFVFGRSSHSDPYTLWTQRDGLGSLLQMRRAGTSDQESAQLILSQCTSGGEIMGALSAALDPEVVANEIDLVPRPALEWVASFVARSTEIPADADTFDATFDVSFPGRYQSRTVVQGLLAVDRSEVETGKLGDHVSYNFLVDGEVLRRGELFESFRYRFDLPVEYLSASRIPLILQRYLRPGAYELVVKLEDLNAERYFRVKMPLVVPAVEARRVVTAAAVAAEEAFDPAAPARPMTTTLLSEANSGLTQSGDYTIHLMAPPRKLHTGRLRLEAITTGDDIAKVSFALNGRRVMSKTRPPFSVELSLGKAPRTHTVEAVAMDAAGHQLARDEILINAGAQSFSIRLIEPRQGQIYEHSLRAQAEVEVPATTALDRVEFYLNETLLATLFQAPYTQPILLQGIGEVGYVRAVAYLSDGHSVEDLVFINAPDYVDRMEVNMVELYTSILDRRGRPVEDIGIDEVKVTEDGVEQQVLRIESIEDLPVHAGILLDTSTSMMPMLLDAERAALEFFETVLTPKDRAAVITFNDQPQLEVPFTNSLPVLAGGLAGLTAEGETAFHDSLVYALYYFSGLRGKRALIVISDGADSSSRYDFEETLDYARHAGIAIYSIGLKLPAKEMQARGKLQRLSTETGGQHFFIDRAVDMSPIYEKIEEEIRSQYLIVYQSSAQGTDFRKVEIEVTRPGVRAKTIPGYYP